MNFALSPRTVIRAEPKGALIFQQESAETALLDMEGLDTLYFLIKGKLREYPIFFVNYLFEKRFIVQGQPDDSLRLLEEVRDKASEVPAPLRSFTAPETIHIAVTSRCDQRCRGCFYSSGSGSDMEFQLFEKIVEEGSEAGVFQIALGGGEPLLHPKLIDMVRLARQSGIVPNITTNGNFLTAETASALKEAGLGQIQISLNGANEGMNSATRPNFRSALKAIEVCKKVGLRSGINFLLTQSNVSDLEAVISLGVEMGVATVNILRPKPPTEDENWLERESLTATEYLDVQRRLRKLKVAEPTRITIDASLTFLLTHHPSDLLFRRGIWGCTAGRRFVTVTEKGDILPCSHVRWSDTGEGRVMQAWWNSNVLDKFRKLEDIIRGPCRVCEHLGVCRGCPSVTMAFGMEFAESDPHCPKRAK
jgi:pyrroloquinoline quinone biosynthesis protein E